MFKIKECHQNSEYLIAVDQAAGAHYKQITVSIAWKCLRELLKLFLTGKKSYTSKSEKSNVRRHPLISLEIRQSCKVTCCLRPYLGCISCGCTACLSSALQLPVCALSSSRTGVTPVFPPFIPLYPTLSSCRETAARKGEMRHSGKSSHIRVRRQPRYTHTETRAEWLCYSITLQEHQYYLFHTVFKFL